MNNKYKEISESVDKIFVKGSYFYSEYVVNQLKMEHSLSIINKIIEKSKKTPAEAIIVLLAAIRFYYKDIYALKRIEEADSFKSTLTNFHHEIMEIAVNGKVQGNIPERAMPIIEILSEKVNNSKIAVIELGASFGLIGTCLLNSNLILKQSADFMQANQQLPKNVKEIEFYVGIDLNPPTQDWLLACFSDSTDAERTLNYINNSSSSNNFHLIKASALGFSNLDIIKELCEKDYQIIVLTSFMLYQLSDELQIDLTNQIKDFCKKNNGHWIRQEVQLFGGLEKPDYSIEWDSERIINLSDDKCTNWSWVKN